MKSNYTFKQMERSSAIVEFSELKLKKLAKFSYRISSVNFVFKMERYNYITEIIISGSEGPIQAIASSDQFTTSVEKAIHKIVKQLSKAQSKLVAHKKPQNSKYGRLARLKSNLETDHNVRRIDRRRAKAA